jgi:hypothetical protein
MATMHTQAQMSVEGAVGGGRERRPDARREKERLAVRANRSKVGAR